MNEKQSQSRLDELARSFTAEYLQENLQDKTVMSTVLKFHQRTTWQEIGDYEIETRLTDWLNLVQYNDILPEYFQEKFKFGVKKEEKSEGNSKRVFDLTLPIAYDTLGEILHSAFGLAEGYRTKPYPSAGALYPIIPLLVIISEDAINKLFPGVYVFDSRKTELLLIKSFTDEDILNISKNIYGGNLSNVFIGYSLDVRRAITKYRTRGYRHALIEVGLMAQSFREAIKKHNHFGDCLISGYNDNALTSILGMNPRISPVVSIQWFGKYI
ncbi:hypothetical protein J7E78_17815 [Paenibacillus polymyxa]|uniref:hypothetical protein n=1 Tax=Paenibacillus polymyxa TaxID=1406 RepID=UPI001BE669AA|nr:hypothetical protein [Paenibacillus polymyxa]MBT2285402.1 hypothetical protein [Paenibacillus polymyxa]